MDDDEGRLCLARLSALGKFLKKHHERHDGVVEEEDGCGIVALHRIDVEHREGSEERNVPKPRVGFVLEDDVDKSCSCTEEAECIDEGG